MGGSLKLVYPILAIAIVLISACSNSDFNEAKEETSAPVEHQLENPVLSELRDFGTTFIAFYVEPENRYVCQRIEVQISRYDAETNLWTPETDVVVEFDLLNPGQRENIRDQLKTVPVDAADTYGVTQIVCKPFEEDEVLHMKLTGRAVLKPNKINYIGELVQHKFDDTSFLYSRSFKRAEEAKAKLEELSPELLNFFEETDFVEERFKNYNGKFVTFADIVENVDQAQDYYRLKSWMLKTAHFYEQQELAFFENLHDAQYVTHQAVVRDINHVTRLSDYANERLYKFDDLVERGISINDLSIYFALMANYDQARARYHSYRHSPPVGGSKDYCTGHCQKLLRKVEKIDEQLEEVVQVRRLDVSDSKKEMALKAAQTDLRVAMYDAQKDFLTYAFRYRIDYTDQFVDQAFEYLDAYSDALAALEWFDIQRETGRANVNKEEVEQLRSVHDFYVRSRHNWISTGILRLQDGESYDWGDVHNLRRKTAYAEYTLFELKQQLIHRQASN